MSQSEENPSQHPAPDSSAQGQPSPEWRPPMYSADAAAVGYGAAQPQAQPPVPGTPAPATPAPGTPAYEAPVAGAPAPATPPPAYMAPQEPRKRRVWPWVVSGLLLVMLLFGCIGTAVMAVVNAGDGEIVGGDKIAVIPLQGVISGSSSGQSGPVSPEKYRELLQRAQDDEAVKAVVLRVDSPGGTVAASEEIATYVKELRKSKPVVVSVGDLDASGAYMISSQATKIVANPGSAVGSIGVILEVANASRLMDKVGLEFKVITAGKYKDAGSPYRAITPEETAMLQSQIDEIYAQFINIVAEGRKMPRSEVESLATGWAWSGTEAKKLGLVDEIGTYQDALDLAAEIAKIDAYDVETYEENDFGDLINLLAGVESFMRAFSASSLANPTSSQSPALAR